MRLRAVFGVLGHILRPFSFLLLVPTAVDLFHGLPMRALHFALTAAGAFGVGAFLARLHPQGRETSRVESLAVVAGTWVLAALVGAGPYIVQGFSPIDAIFESMSGFTTTGATIFKDQWSWFQPSGDVASPWEWAGIGGGAAPLSPGLILWRSMTQWLGGMGIIVLFVAVLPALAVSGRQMFFAEAPGPSDEAMTPRIRHTALALWRVYIGLTLIEVLVLHYVGDMIWYDAVCHSFTTLAAGGFSPHPESIAGYGPTVQWIIVPFMFLAGASFALQYRATRRPKVLFHDRELRAYLLVVVAAGAGISLLLFGSELGGGPRPFGESLRHGAFQTVSILTTTGYASDNFDAWHEAPLMILFALMFIGGCAGSAGGGPKVIRIMLLARFLTREVLTSLHPRAVWTIKIGGKPVQRETMRQVLGFLLAYITFFGVAALAVGIAEDNLKTGLTGSIVTLGNIGPGFGAIGPMGTFGGLSVFSKILLIVNMWVGRLEVMTVLVLFHPHVLRTLLEQRKMAASHARTGT